MAIADNGLQLYGTSYAVQSAITATSELLVVILTVVLWVDDVGFSGTVTITKAANIADVSVH